MINHSSILKAPLFAPPCNASRTSLTGVRRGKRRRDKVDRVLLFELNRRADEMIGLEADNSGSFVVYFDRTAIEKDPNKTTSRPFLSYLRRHRPSARQVTPPGGLLRPRARDWSGHEARLGSRVGRVGRYDRAAAPHMRVGPRGRALSRVQRPPQWRAARAGGADVTPT